MGFLRRRRRSSEKKAPSAPKADSIAMIGLEKPREEGQPLFNIDASDVTYRDCQILDRARELTDEERQWYQDFEARLERKEVDLTLVPSGAVDIITLLNDPSCSMRELAEAILLEPMLAGSVMGLANSPMFRGSVEVSDLVQATMRLGQKHLKMVLMTALMDTALVKGEPFEAYSLLTWKHSLMVARLCRSLARPANLDPEVGYMAGLFHNVGRVAILSGARHVNKKTRKKVTARTLLQLLHVHGYAINAKIIGEWNLAEDVVQAVKHYRAQPGSRYAGPYAMLVGLADATCKKFGIWAEASDQNLEAHPALEALEISARHLPSVNELNQLAEEIDRTAIGG